MLTFLDPQGTSSPRFLFITGERDRASRRTTHNAVLRTRRRGPVAARPYDVERRPFDDHFHSAFELCNSHRSLPDLAGNRQVLLRAGPARQPDRVLPEWLRCVAIAALFTRSMPQRLHACLLQYRYNLEQDDGDSLHMLPHGCRLYMRRYCRWPQHDRDISGLHHDIRGGHRPRAYHSHRWWKHGRDTVDDGECRSRNRCEQRSGAVQVRGLPERCCRDGLAFCFCDISSFRHSHTVSLTSHVPVWVKLSRPVRLRIARA